MAHDFARKEIRPVAWGYDKEGTWPQAIIEKAWEVGLMNSQVPDTYGGCGASSLDGCLIAEELAWGCAGIGTTLEANGLASAPLLLGGSEKLPRHAVRARDRGAGDIAVSVNLPQHTRDRSRDSIAPFRRSPPCSRTARRSSC